VPHQELVARPQGASPRDVTELRNQGWRAGVGDNAGRSAARHAELDERLRSVFDFELRMSCLLSDGCDDLCMIIMCVTGWINVLSYFPINIGL
jgi:hypothetical protein